MGVSIIASDNGAVMYCDTTGWAFGPVLDNRLDAEAFLQYMRDEDVDPRSCDTQKLSEYHSEYQHMIRNCDNPIDKKIELQSKRW